MLSLSKQITNIILNSSNDILFYGVLLSSIEAVEDKNMKNAIGITLKDNTYHLRINPTKFDTLSLLEQKAALIHEAMHITNKHMYRQNGRNMYLWNYACDIAINQYIDNLPEFCLSYEKFNLPSKLTAEQYYELLKNNDKLAKDVDNFVCSFMCDNLYEDADNTTDTNETTTDTKLSSQHNDIHEWNASEVEEEINDQILSKLLESTKNKCGFYPKEVLSSIKVVKENISYKWKSIIHNMVCSKRVSRESSILKQNRRFPDNPDIYGYKKKYTYNLGVILDVSGSISNDNVIKFLNYINNLSKKTNSSIKLVQVDTEAYGVEKYKKTDNFIRRGTGGTKMFPGISLLSNYKEKIDGIIIFTDGFIEEEFPKKPFCNTVILYTKFCTLNTKYNNIRKIKIDL